MNIGSMLKRTLRAAALDKSVFEEVEHDKTLDREALVVVIIVATLDTLGLLLARYLSPDGLELVRGILLLAYGILGGVFVYYLWAGITYFLGTQYFGGTANVGQLRRTLGYAQGPRGLGVFAFVPTIGVFINLLSALWAVAVGIVAVRQALDVTTGRAVATVVLGWGVAIMIFMFVGMLLGFYSIVFLLL